MPIQYVSVPKWLVCQCQYSIISAPRATKAHAACRHCPSNAGKLVDGPPIAPALVSVIKNELAWRRTSGPPRGTGSRPLRLPSPAGARWCSVAPAHPAFRNTGFQR
jgi:hypothetical protein